MHSRRLEQAELIDKGLTSDVFAWGAGCVLKLLHKGFPLSKAEREFNITRAVHAIGCPAPAALDVIERDGRFGIVFERVDGPSLFEVVQASPWKLISPARKLAEMHAQLHACLAPDALPAQRRQIGERIDAAPGVAEHSKREARLRLAELPDGDTLCHGDFHPKNILLTERGPRIIDWGGATRGDALGDVARTSHLFQNAELPAETLLHVRLLFGAARSFLHRVYLRRYLQLRPGMREQIRAWELPVRIAATAWRAEMQLS